METRSATSFTQQDWEHYARCYDRLNELTPYQAMLEEVARALRAQEGEHILDAACGTGNLTTRLEQGSGAIVTGCDYSEVMLARAQGKCGDRAPLLRTNLNRPLPFADHSFDAVACVNTLYAVANPAHLLSEFSRVLRGDGRIVLVTPKAGYENGLILKAHCKSPKPDAHWEQVHLDQAREEERIREACGNTALSTDLIQVGAWNRLISVNSRFHFFTGDKLEGLILHSGFTITERRMTYAGQCHLIVAVKPLP